jgi:hypothetical protein
MPNIKRRGYRMHIALVVFLGLVAALGIVVKLAHSQTKEAATLTEQMANFARNVVIPKR